MKYMMPIANKVEQQKHLQFIAIALAKSYGICGNLTGATAIMVHLILSGLSIEGGMDISYLGASGLFTCIISAILSVEVTRILTKKKIIIKLPDSVPSMVGESFAALIPLIVNALIAVVIANICLAASGKVFPAFIMSILAPALSTMDTLPALLIVLFLFEKRIFKQWYWLWAALFLFVYGIRMFAGQGEIVMFRPEEGFLYRMFIFLRKLL